MCRVSVDQGIKCICSRGIRPNADVKSEKATQIDMCLSSASYCILYSICCFGWSNQEKMRWARHVARMWQGRRAYSVLIGRPEGRKPLWRPRHRWEKNIKMDLKNWARETRT